MASLMPLQRTITPWKVRLCLAALPTLPPRQPQKALAHPRVGLALWLPNRTTSPSLLPPLQTPPRIRPFHQEDFLKSLEHSGPQLTCVLKGDWLGLYRYPPARVAEPLPLQVKEPDLWAQSNRPPTPFGVFPQKAGDPHLAPRGLSQPLPGIVTQMLRLRDFYLSSEWAGLVRGKSQTLNDEVTELSRLHGAV